MSNHYDEGIMEQQILTGVYRTRRRLNKLLSLELESSQHLDLTFLRLKLH